MTMMNNNNVLCLLNNPDGSPLGAPMYLPQNFGPQQLQQIVNNRLSISFLTIRRSYHILSTYQIRSCLYHLQPTCTQTNSPWRRPCL